MLTVSSFAVEVAPLQSALDTQKDTLLASLTTVLGRVQQTYESKVKGLVETSVFKAVECLGYLNATETQVNVVAIKDSYQKAILEKYVDLSADIKRYAVGLTSNESSLSDDIADFGRSFLGQISSIESTYDMTYEKLKTDFSTYYNQNQQLAISLAEKLQKIDAIKEKYVALQRAERSFYEEIDYKTNFRNAVELPKKSALALLQGDLDAMIRGYQATNPEVSYEKMLEKRDALVQEFSMESDSFLYEPFKSDFDYTLYTKTLVKVQEFLRQYVNAERYQCGAVIASTANWERVYLSLTNEIEPLLLGYAKILSKVEKWTDEQAKTVETALLAAYKEAYSKTFSQKKMAFRTYVMQLISEAYYATTPSGPIGNEGGNGAPAASTPTTWTSYTFTKSYTKGTYAVELTYLQQFLKAEGLYQGEINGKYDTATIEAVYKFQLQEGVVTGKETNKAAYGWMGPATRAAVNAKMH